MDGLGAAAEVAGSGHAAIPAAFALGQFGMLDQRAWSYLGLELVGSLVLAVDAFREDQFGCLLLEGV